MSDRMSWGQYAYAGFWRRFAAILIDGLVLSAATSAIAAFVGPPVLVEPFDPQTLQLRPGWLPVAAGWSVVNLVAFLAYETAMLSTLGWTLGKRVVGVEVRGADGAILSVPRALGRALGKFVSGLPLYLGFLWAAWDPRKQAWHDKFVSSFALKRTWLEPVGQPPPGQLRPQPQRQPAGAPGASPWGIPGQPEGGPAAPPQQAPDTPTGTVWQRGSGSGWDAPAGDGDAPARADEEAGARDVGAPAPGGPEGAPAAEPGPEPATEPGPEPEAQAAEEPAGAEPPPGEEPTILDHLDLGVDEVGAHEEPPVLRDDTAAPDAAPASVQGTPTGPEQAAAGGEEEPAEPPPAGGGPGDPNRVAVAQAGIAPESAAWLEQVAHQVEPRLDRVAPGWRSAPQAVAAQACAFGLLLGHLAHLYPHMRNDLSRVAEEHPSYSTLPAGERLETLQGIAGDPGRATAWLGPLIGVEDPRRLRALFE